MTDWRDRVMGAYPTTARKFDLDLGPMVIVKEWRTRTAILCYKENGLFCVCPLSEQMGTAIAQAVKHPGVEGVEFRTDMTATDIDGLLDILGRLHADPSAN